MKANDKQLDKLIRLKLEALEHPRDAGLWNDIETQLNKPQHKSFFQRKRNIFFSLALLAVISSTIFVLKFNSQDSVRNNSTSTNSYQVISNNDDIQSESHVVNESEVAVDNKTESELILPSRLDETVSVKQVIEKKSHAVNQVSKKLKTEITGNVIIAETQDDASTNTAQTLVEADSQIDPAAEEILKERFENITDIKTLNETIVTNEDEAMNELIVLSDSLANVQAQLQTDSIISENVAAVLEEMVSSNPVNESVVLDTSAIEASDETESEVNLNIPANPFANKRFIWSIGLQSQLVNVSKEVSTTEKLLPEYYQRRKSEEKNALAINYGLRFSVEFKRINLQTGIGTRTFAEDIQYTNRATNYYLSRGSSNDYDTTVVNEVNNKIDDNNGYHANRYTEIPVMIGYRLGNNLLSVKPMIGMSFAMPQSWSSNYLNEKANDLVSPEQEYELNKTVKSFVSEINFSLGLSKHFSLDAFGVYHVNQQSVFKKVIDQRYTSVGGGVGLHYSF